MQSIACFHSVNCDNKCWDLVSDWVWKLWAGTPLTALTPTRKRPFPPLFISRLFYFSWALSQTHLSSQGNIYQAFWNQTKKNSWSESSFHTNKIMNEITICWRWEVSVFETCFFIHRGLDPVFVGVCKVARSSFFFFFLLVLEKGAWHKSRFVLSRREPVTKAEVCRLGSVSQEQHWKFLSCRSQKRRCDGRWRAVYGSAKSL